MSALVTEMKMDCSSGSSNGSTSGSTDDIFSSTASVFLSSDDDAGDGETFYEDNGIFVSISLCPRRTVDVRFCSLPGLEPCCIRKN